jgi:hypothetical protein
MCIMQCGSRPLKPAAAPALGGCVDRQVPHRPFSTSDIYHRVIPVDDDVGGRFLGLATRFIASCTLASALAASSRSLGNAASASS